MKWFRKKNLLNVDCMGADSANHFINSQHTNKHWPFGIISRNIQQVDLRDEGIT
jgi:hypothetical protein